MKISMIKSNAYAGFMVLWLHILEKILHTNTLVVSFLKFNILFLTNQTNKTSTIYVFLDKNGVKWDLAKLSVEQADKLTEKEHCFSWPMFFYRC